ncbi:MAG: hypothetical protein RLZZ258_1124 [Actinomycetota bacterium]|jgi:phenylpyruvate tautomerase PptA (4-oxalocrotonate tautomerase family)
MPLVRIDLLAPRSHEHAREIADAIHRSIVSEYGIPASDRFQILNFADEVIAEDAGLGFNRSRDVVMIQIFTQRGRTVEAKQSLYAALAQNLGHIGIEPEDVFIGYFENGPEDWSFGFGRAQYMTGELKIPIK